MSVKKIPNSVNFDPSLYKKHPRFGGFWTSTDTRDRYPISTPAAFFISFAFWPITTWFWTKSVIWPIFIIPPIAILFAFSMIYLDSGLYLLVGCLNTFLGVGVNCSIMLQNSGAHFEPTFDVRDWNPEVYGKDQ